MIFAAAITMDANIPDDLPNLGDPIEVVAPVDEDERVYPELWGHVDNVESERDVVISAQFEPIGEEENQENNEMGWMRMKRFRID